MGRRALEKNQTGCFGRDGKSRRLSCGERASRGAGKNKIFKIPQQKAMSRRSRPDREKRGPLQRGIVVEASGCRCPVLLFMARQPRPI